MPEGIKHTILKILFLEFTIIGDKMKINIKNNEKINAALQATQKNCRVRLLDAVIIQKKIASIEKFLSERLHKKDWIDLQFTIYSAGGTYPNSYRGRPECTIIVVEKCASGWFMSYCGRCYQPTSTATIIPKNIEIKTKNN